MVLVPSGHSQGSVSSVQVCCYPLSLLTKLTVVVSKFYGSAPTCAARLNFSWLALPARRRALERSLPRPQCALPPSSRPTPSADPIHDPNLPLQRTTEMHHCPLHNTPRALCPSQNGGSVPRPTRRCSLRPPPLFPFAICPFPLSTTVFTT